MPSVISRLSQRGRQSVGAGPCFDEDLRHAGDDVHSLSQQGYIPPTANHWTWGGAQDKTQHLHFSQDYKIAYFKKKNCINRNCEIWSRKMWSKISHTEAESNYSTSLSVIQVVCKLQRQKDTQTQKKNYMETENQLITKKSATLKYNGNRATYGKLPSRHLKLQRRHAKWPGWDKNYKETKPTTQMQLDIQ